MTTFSPDIVYHGDDIGLAYWMGGHFYEHKAMLAVGLSVGYNVPDYDLYSWAPDDRTAQRSWLEVHNLVHVSLRQLTGVGGPDYADVDFGDKRQFDEWMHYHAQEHQQLRSALGLS